MTGTDGPAVTEIIANGDNAADDPGRLRKHSLVIAGHRTSISLEDAFWHALTAAARRRGESVTSLVTTIDATRAGNLSSAIRVHVLTELTERLQAFEIAAETSPPRR